MGSRPARVLLIIASVIALVASTAGAASAAASQLNSLDEIATADDDLNSTAVETSGATYNADSHVLFTLDDEHNAYEFPLTADGAIDQSQQPRVIELALDTDDFEGVAWITGQTYAFLSEGSGEVIIADVPTGSNATVRTSNIDRRFSVISGTWGNLGPEGLATDGSAFYVVREMPATMSKFDWHGQFIGSVALTQLDDASGIAVLADDTFLVVSHESRVVAHYDIDWAAETVTTLDSRPAPDFTQLEGIAVTGTTDVHLFGEDNSRKGNPGQTYAHLHGELVPTIYSVSDLNCSGTVTVADALLVTKIQTGLMEPIPGCGSGDHNGDGKLTVVDAVMIAQCQVGIPNIGCPNVGD